MLKVMCMKGEMEDAGMRGKGRQEPCLSCVYGWRPSRCERLALTFLEGKRKGKWGTRLYWRVTVELTGARPR